jgi:hypothetical protein
MRSWDDRDVMTQQLEVSIIAAPLAAIDRRALSQAWYSALRLASGSRPTAARASSQRRAGTEVAAHPKSAPSPARFASGRTRPPRAAATTSTVICGHEAAADLRLRAVRCALAARIERAFADPSAHPKRATFSVGEGCARVYVVLQTHGASTTLLAICTPEMQAIVARALAQARFALAARGFGVEPPLKGSLRCSQTRV